MGIDSDVYDLASAMGADFYGVADLGAAREAILDQGGPAVARYPRALSVGIALMNTIVDQLPHRERPAVAMTYQRHAYDVVNQRLDFVTSHLASRLQRQGFAALPVAASQIVDDERLCGIFSNKMAAHLAGLGWIGKSCLLVTPEVGPRARWATVLTDAPLAATGKPMEERCSGCRECVEICPVGAFTGRPFDPHEPREARFDAHKCDVYLDELRATTGVSTCGMCLYVCPFGRD